MKDGIIKLITWSILLALLLDICIAIENDKIYSLELNYDMGVLTSKGVIATLGFAPDRNVQPEAGYSVEVVSFDGKILESFKFQVPLIIYTDLIDPENGQITGEVIQLNKTDFSLRINYFKNGKVINIYNPEKEKVLEIDISKFADVCGDDICQEHEDHLTCPQDCPGKAGKTDNNYPIYYIILAIVIMTLALFLAYRKIQEKKKWEELERKYTKTQPDRPQFCRCSSDDA